MSTVSQVKAPPSLKYESFVEERMARARWRIRVLDLTSALLGLLTATLAYGLIITFCDRWFNLPSLMRQVAFGLYALAALGYLAVAVVRPLMRQVNPYFAAKEVERDLPDAKNSVLNWLDLRGQPLHSAIRGAVTHRAAKDLARADLDHAISARRTSWLTGTVVGLTLGLLILFFLGPRQFLSLLGRAFAPFVEASIATRTHLILLKPDHGDVTVAVGRPVSFVVDVEGKIPEPTKPDALKLLYRYQNDEPFLERLLERVESTSEWTTTLPAFEIHNGFTYKVTGGDAQTPEFQVHVRSTPLLTDFEANYHYRPYVNRPDESKREPNLEGLRGTEVTLLARTNRKIQEGSLEIEHGVPKQESGNELNVVKGEPVADDPRALRFRFVLDKDGTYRIWFASLEGEKNTDPMPYSIKVLPDNAPVVDLTKPGKDIELPANGILEVEGAANDDFGLTKLTLCLLVEPSKKPIQKSYRQGKSFRLENGTFPLKMDYKDFVDLETVKQETGQSLQPGMEIRCWLEATDNCDYPQPHVGKSSEFTIKITEALQNPQKQKQQRRAAQEQQKHEQGQDQQLAQNNQPKQDQAKPEDEPKKQDQPKVNDQNQQNQKEKDAADGNQGNAKNEKNLQEKADKLNKAIQDEQQEKPGAGNDQPAKEKSNPDDGKGQSKEPNGDQKGQGDNKEPKGNGANKDNKEENSDQSKGGEPKPGDTQKEDKQSPAGKQDQADLADRKGNQKDQQDGKSNSDGKSGQGDAKESGKGEKQQPEAGKDRSDGNEDNKDKKDQSQANDKNNNKQGSGNPQAGGKEASQPGVDPKKPSPQANKGQQPKKDAGNQDSGEKQGDQSKQQRKENQQQPEDGKQEGGNKESTGNEKTGQGSGGKSDSKQAAGGKDSGTEDASKPSNSSKPSAPGKNEGNKDGPPKKDPQGTGEPGTKDQAKSDGKPGDPNGNGTKPEKGEAKPSPDKEPKTPAKEDDPSKNSASGENKGLDNQHGESAGQPDKKGTASKPDGLKENKSDVGNKGKDPSKEGSQDKSGTAQKPSSANPGKDKQSAESPTEAKVKDLIKALKNGDATVRKDAARKLEDEKDFIKDPELRKAAEDALKKQGDSKKPGDSKNKPSGLGKAGENKPESAAPGSKPEGNEPGKAPPAGKETESGKDGLKKGEGTKIAAKDAGEGKGNPKPADKAANADKGDGGKQDASGQNGPKGDKPSLDNQSGGKPGGGSGPRKSPAEDGPTDTGKETSPANPRFQKKAGVLQLEDFKKKVTPDVLKKAQMTDQEYRDFLKAYEDMIKRQRAEAGAEKLSDPKATGGLLPNLRSRQVDPKVKGVADNLQHGGLALPPPEFREAYKEFSRKLSNLEKGREEK